MKEHNSFDRKELMKRVEICRRYACAVGWKKPFIDPVRCLRNQWRKKVLGLFRRGAPLFVEVVHMEGFVVVIGEECSESIASHGAHELDLTEGIIRIVRPGDVAVDIGMHLGFYSTLLAVLVGEGGRVHAFEPTPSTRQVAASNTDHFEQIQVHPEAVYGRSTTLMFSDYGIRWMAFNSLAAPRVSGVHAVSKYEVSTVSLDEWYDKCGTRVAFVKIDAESSELEILKGARRFLAASRPVLAIEIGDVGMANESRSIIDELESQGYESWEMHDGTFVRHASVVKYGHTNLFFSPSSNPLDKYSKTVEPR